MRQATTVMNTFPDRVVSKNIKVEHLNSEVIPGIPTHLLLEFSASMEPPERGVTRLKRTATFELNSDKLLDEEVQTQMRIEVKDAHKGEENETLPVKWERWHMKAEIFFNDGVKGGYFLVTGKAERSKGSAPSSRPVASKPKRRGGDPIALVRLRKLELLIGHDMLNSHPDAEVSDKIFRKYTSLVNSDIIAHKAKEKITLEDALQAVHAEIAAHEARIASDGHKKWRSLFSGQFGVDGWRAASTVIHEQADCPSFNTESMSQEWTKIWRPEDHSYDENYYAERWKFYAATTQVDIPKSTFEGSWLPSYDDFRPIAEKAKGGAGFDGWTAIELRLLCRFAPFLIQELHHLWCETAAYLERAITDPVLQKMLMHWRVVGVPKKDPLQNRPISVASVLFRTWLTACEPKRSPVGVQERDEWCHKQLEKRRLLLHRLLEKSVPLREQLGRLQEHVRLPVR